MIKIKNITVKNFLSIGNVTQQVNLDRNDLTLVLGENVDLGSDGARNGVGKTAILNAISYALYGNALTNIRKDNLINRTNAKNMIVSLSFEVNGKEYRIERGRRPNFLKVFVGGEQSNIDDAQGDSRETQAEIERILNMSHDMFKHVVALNTYTPAFLSLRNNDQRAIIEQLLGITLLSERAEKIKELMRVTKANIITEEQRIKATQEANIRITEQINSLKTRQKLWLKKQQEDCVSFQNAINDLDHVNIEEEILAHNQLVDWTNDKAQIDEAQRWIQNIESDNKKQEKIIVKLDEEIKLLTEHKCYACGQEMHDDKQESILTSKEEQKQEAARQLGHNAGQLQDYTETIAKIGKLSNKPTTFYNSVSDAHEHKNTLANLANQLVNKDNEEDPYTEQIDEMQSQALQAVDYDNINQLNVLLDHQDFLYKLLTNKDSFVRKRIIDQNLAFLNKRLTSYLSDIGLPHQVIFQNDLNVEITELGRELDFDNLSRGERNRLILSMSWAFRDVWENLYHPINILFIDEMIDSGMDTVGVEASIGILKKMSRTRNKSIWLISHKDELVARVENVMKVVKENGFTNYQNADVI
jgi:DNA repair exonuclease SbcCD ATPase subunit